MVGAAVRPDINASPVLARRIGYAAPAAEADRSAHLFLSIGVGDHPPSEDSRDILRSVRAAAAHGLAHGDADILTCTDAYHQPRVRLLFAMPGLASRPVLLASRGPKRLRAKMGLREAAAIPQDLIAGADAIGRSR